MRHFISILILILLFQYTDSLSQWQSCNGPYGGSLNALANNGSFVFAGTYSGGFYKSSDDGSTWTQANFGLTNTTINCLVIKDQYVFAGTLGGVFRLPPSGASWVAVNNGITFHSIYTLAVSGNHLFAGTYGGGAFVSTNNGNSWTAINNGLSSIYIRTSAVGFGYIYMGTEGGVFRSNNAGASWSATNNGLNPLSTFSLGVAGGNLYAGTYNGGVYRSVNEGASWTAVNSGIPANTTVNVFIGVNWNILAGTYSNGIYVSSNSGNSWTQENNGFPGNTSLYSFTIKNNLIFAGTNGSGAWKRILSQIIGIKQIASIIPDEFSLSQNYPNPFNPKTKIKMQIAKLDDVKLIIYDALGRKVETLVNKQLKSGTYEVEFDGSNYTSGVYFYRLEAGNFISVKRMMLLK